MRHRAAAVAPFEAVALGGDMGGEWKCARCSTKNDEGSYRCSSCGLLRGSFRPGDAIVRMRGLQRQMANLVGERTRCVQWMQKTLDQMNVQIHRAVTDLAGFTGITILRAIVAGERDPARLAALRHYRCRKSAKEIERYLTGNWREEHLFNLASALRIFDTLETEIASYETRLLEELEALQPPERKLQPVPAHHSPSKEKAGLFQKL